MCGIQIGGKRLAEGPDERKDGKEENDNQEKARGIPRQSATEPMGKDYEDGAAREPIKKLALPQRQGLVIWVFRIHACLL